MRDEFRGGDVPPIDALHSAATSLTAFLRDRYDVQVQLNLGDEPDAVDIGALEGRTIRVNLGSRSALEAIFVICHLFGHVVQFSQYERYRRLVETVEEPKPLRLSESFKAAFAAYELEAYEYGRELLRQAVSPSFADQVDVFYRVYYETDLRLFIQYIETGQRISAHEFLRILHHDYGAGPAVRTPIACKMLPRHVSPQKDAIIY